MSAAQQISLGRVVHYRLSEHDATIINRRRPVAAGYEPPAGTQRHVGNGVSAGDVFPLVVTRVWSAEGGTINGQVLLDGNDNLWVTSVSEATSPDQTCAWFWPPRT